MSNLYIGDDDDNKHHLIKLHMKVSQSKRLHRNIWNSVWQPKHSVEVTHMAALHETVKEPLPWGAAATHSLTSRVWAGLQTPLSPSARSRPTAHGGREILLVAPRV